MARETERRESRRGRGTGRGRWGRLRRYGEQGRRWEEEEKKEELPSLVAAIHEGEIIIALTVIKLVGGWYVDFR